MPSAKLDLKTGEVTQVPDPVQPPPPTIDEIDQATLNSALAAKGSAFRALAILTFKEVNKLRVLNGDTAYTLAQFTAAMKAEMQ